MSAISDKLKNTIQAVFDLPNKDIETKIDQIVKATRKGESQGQQIKDILQKIEDVESKVDRVKDTIKTVNSVIKSLDAAKKIAAASEKAAATASALNPASAAISIVQRMIVEQVGKEIEEAKNALNVVPKLIQNFNKFIIETKEKLKKVQKERERKKALREQRKRKLNS